MILGSVLDAMLCAGLLVLAAWAVTAGSEFRSSLLYTLFGLLMAVVWARLGSIDLALAEGAIGAGVTGALLLRNCRSTPEPAGPETRNARRVPAAVASLAAGTALGALMWRLSSGDGAAAGLRAAALRDHFLDNPVNAVLLDVRGYDTLLEVAVLLLALVCIRALSVHAALPVLQPARGADRILTTPLLRLMTPLLTLTAIHLVWLGGHAPGGAFQGGVLMAGLGVLYQLTGRLRPAPRATLGLRALLAAGPALFTLFACAGIRWAGVPLAYPVGAAYAWSMAIEFTLSVSIAATLVVLFAATPGIRFRSRP